MSGRGSGLARGLTVFHAMRANVDVLATGVAVILMLMLVGGPQKGVPARAITWPLEERAQQGAGAARHLKHNAVPLSELVSRRNPLCTDNVFTAVLAVFTTVLAVFTTVTTVCTSSPMPSLCALPHSPSQVVPLKGALGNSILARPARSLPTLAAHLLLCSSILAADIC